jgi:putative ABC transport system permease protein
MNIWRLIAKEILHRKVSFLLSCLSAAAAVAVVCGTILLLHLHDHLTERIIDREETSLRKRMAGLEDDYRKITKAMGFNILILPKSANLGDLYAEDYAAAHMPEDYAAKLSQAGIASINHLLPCLQQKIKWPEQQRTILLIGTRGEIPSLGEKLPLQEPVPPGAMVMGYELYNSLKFKVGQTVQLLGRAFTLTRTNPERGNKDDITIWINLIDAQELLDKKGMISAILALECQCQGDRLGKIRSDIAAILPDTQVIEFASQALARAEAREKAASAASEALSAQKLSRAHLRAGREEMAALIGPLVLAACAICLGLLAWGNVRSRRSEIGILRAIGTPGYKVLLLFLTRSALAGLIGAIGGYAIGAAAALLLREPQAPANWAIIFDWRLFVIVLAGAPLMSVLSAWLPALVAQRQDPADVLSQEAL